CRSPTTSPLHTPPLHDALPISERWHAIAWTGWAAVLYMAIFSSAVAYVFYFWVLRFLEASQLSALTYLLPVVATILGILLLGERSEEHTSELQSRFDLVCRLLL